MPKKAESNLCPCGGFASRGARLPFFCFFLEMRHATRSIPAHLWHEEDPRRPSCCLDRHRPRQPPSCLRQARRHRIAAAVHAALMLRPVFFKVPHTPASAGVFLFLFS